MSGLARHAANGLKTTPERWVGPHWLHQPNAKAIVIGAAGPVNLVGEIVTITRARGLGRYEIRTEAGALYSIDGRLLKRALVESQA